MAILSCSTARVPSSPDTSSTPAPSASTCPAEKRRLELSPAEAGESNSSTPQARSARSQAQALWYRISPVRPWRSFAVNPPGLLLFHHELALPISRRRLLQQNAAAFE